MRYGSVFSTVFALFGVVLMSGSLVMVPYTVLEEVRVDRSKTWMEETFTLQPNKNRTHVFDSIARNLSIFQMDLQPSLPMVLKIVDDNRGELVFEWLRGGTIFWTPPSISGNWRFIFENPSSTMMNVSATVTEFYLKANEEREATYYRSLFDPFYGYSGIIAIIVAIGQNVIHLIRAAKRRK